jgi:acetyltransferase
MIVAPKAVELIAGVTDDLVFGPVMVFGRGGTAVEVINDRALALPPLDANLARDLIARTRVARQLRGYRDRKPVDIDRLAGILQRLAQLVAEHPAIADIDLNPLIAEADRLMVVDARVTLVSGSPASGAAMNHPRLSIRPYPTEWEESIALPDGRSVFVRPARPEDEGRYLDFFSKMTAEDMRLRFFQRVHDLGHAFVARLTQIDYARAMAFVALDPRSGEMLGGVRLHGDPGGGDGEYAVSVRSDLKGIGLGRALMIQIIRYARREGYARIHGEVLAENRQMLQLCEKLGFSLTPDPDGPDIIKVSLDLRSITN